MKIKIFRLLLLFTVVSFFTSCSSDTDNSKTDTSEVPTQKPVPVYTYTSIEEETFALVNSYRKSIGLNTLEKNNYISIQSEEHDHYMIANDEPSHDNFDDRYKNIVENLGAIRVGENIAYNYYSPKSALDAWLKSPLHKECIEGDYSDFGISIRVSPVGKMYWTTIYAKIE